MNNCLKEIPDGWHIVELSEILQYEQPYHYIVLSEEYNDIFGIPVLTAGKSFLLGYTNESDNVYSNLPVIIFDDFTTDSKYVDFPFMVKSSAMKFLRPREGVSIDLKLIFEYIQSLKISVANSDHKRRWISEFSKIKITIPPFEQQIKIADILSTCDAVIEKTQAAIAKYKLIKQGMLHDLFTRGIDIQTGKLRPRYKDAPELYKESKLGWIPKEWECEMLSSVIEIISGGTPSTQIKEYWGGEIPWLSVDDFNTGNRYASKAAKKITEEGLKNSATNMLLPGMLIISARGTVGVIAQMKAPMAFNQSCYGLNTVNEYLSNDFLYYYQTFFIRFIGFKSYGSVFDVITKSSFDEVFIPINKKSDEQRMIVEKLTAIDTNLQSEQSYLEKMQQLKKGLMEDLLSGKKRVKV